jgi:PAS domain S-box-containing protein
MIEEIEILNVEKRVENDSFLQKTAENNCNYSNEEILEIINDFTSILYESSDNLYSIQRALHFIGKKLKLNKIYYFQRTYQKEIDSYVMLTDIMYSENNIPDYIDNIFKNRTFETSDFQDKYDLLKAKNILFLNYSELSNFTRNIFDSLGLFSALFSLVRNSNDIIGILLFNASVVSPEFSIQQIEYIKIISNILGSYLRINKIQTDLANLNRRFRQFTDNVSDGVLITENYQLLYVNEKFKDIFNISSQYFETGDLNSWGFIDLLDIESYVTHYKESDIDKLYEIESWVTKENGERKYIHKQLFDFRNNENKIINCLIVKDITDKKKAEIDLRDNQEKFRLISELTTDCSYSFIITIDSKFEFEWCSGSYKDLFGIPIKSKEMDNLWHAKIFEDDKLKLSMRMNNLLQGRKDISEYRVYDKAGNIRWIRDYGVPVFDQFENRAIKIIGAAADITEQKEAEDKLIAFTEELKNINVTKDKFFSIISHDMKNPIMGFKNLTELLVDDFHTIEKDEMFEILTAMKQSSESLYSMFEDLVQWSKAQMGRIQFNPQEYDITNLILEVIHEQKAIAKAKGIKISNKIKIGTSAIYDNAMITIVIRNLISNAIKFSYPEGEIEILADIINTTDGKIYLVIEVKDTGVGISEENMQKLFKMDSGLTTYGTANEKGSGLGLLLCKEFVQINGGTIWAVSKDSKGTSFKFTIPK